MSTPSRGGRRPPPPTARRTRRTRRRNERSDLGGRVLVALPAIAFAIFIVVQGGLVFAIGVTALGVICLHELYEMTAIVRPVKLAGFLGLIGLVLAAHYGSQFQMVLVTVALVPVVFGLMAMGPRRRSPTLAMAVTLLGVVWIGYAIAHAVLLEDLHNGNAILVNVLVGTFVGDTGAYFGGRMFGRRPLAPALSPNKTLEGLLIGMVFAVAGVMFAGLYEDWFSNAQALLLGVGVALAAPVGDLFESLIKREAGAKDTGRLFGAHGGALDRLDAALFAIPVGYYIWVALM
jgi:phosphatidate cytidylyltransferase